MRKSKRDFGYRYDYTNDYTCYYTALDFGLGDCLLCHFAKEVFGGTGYNIFNVALITRAFCFLLSASDDR